MPKRCLIVLIALAAALLAHPKGSHADFGQKPVFIDPKLGGWAMPIHTVVYKAAVGELYYVTGVYLGERGELNVVCRSRVTLRRFDRQHLGRFMVKLAEALAQPVEALAKEMQLDGVVLTAYCVLLKDSTLGLEIYESCLPAQSFSSVGPVPLRVVERRIEELPAP